MSKRKYMGAFGGVPQKCEKSSEFGEIWSADFVTGQMGALETVPSTSLWGGARYIREWRGINLIVGSTR